MEISIINLHKAEFVFIEIVSHPKRRIFPILIYLLMYLSGPNSLTLVIENVSFIAVRVSSRLIRSLEFS